MDFFGGQPVCKPEYFEKLKQLVNKKPAFVVSTTYCPYCNKAKSLLNRYGIEHEEMMLDELHGNDQVEFANCIYGRNQRFVPFIFLKGKTVGGYGELMQLAQSGTLEKEFAE